MYYMAVRAFTSMWIFFSIKITVMTKGQDIEFQFSKILA